MPAESNAESGIPLMERDVEAQNSLEPDDKRLNEIDELPIPVQTQSQTQAAARKKFLIWTAIK